MTAGLLVVSSMATRHLLESLAPACAERAGRPLRIVSVDTAVARCRITGAAFAGWPRK